MTVLEELVRRGKGAISTRNPPAGVAQGFMLSPKRKLAVVRRNGLDHVLGILRLCQTGNSFRWSCAVPQKAGQGQAGLLGRESSAIMVCLP